MNTIYGLKIIRLDKAIYFALWTLFFYSGAKGEEVLNFS
jgi:hypothetical protein